jgi:hypothetical protein
VFGEQRWRWARVRVDHLGDGRRGRWDGLKGQDRANRLVAKLESQKTKKNDQGNHAKDRPSQLKRSKLIECCNSVRKPLILIAPLTGGDNDTR